LEPVREFLRTLALLHGSKHLVAGLFRRTVANGVETHLQRITGERILLFGSRQDRGLIGEPDQRAHSIEHEQTAYAQSDPFFLNCHTSKRSLAPMRGEGVDAKGTGTLVLRLLNRFLAGG